MLIFPCEPKGKKPLISGWYEAATDDLDTIEGWESQFPGCNWGAPAGRNGWLVLDIDGPEGESAAATLLDGLAAPTVITGKGKHIYLSADGIPSNLLRPAVRIAPGLDVRAGRSYTIVPPSVHPSGKKYAWADTLSPADLPPPRAPQRIIALLASGGGHPAAGTPATAAPDGRRILREGERNNRLFMTGVALRRAGWDGQAITLVLYMLNATRCAPRLPRREVEAIARSAAKGPHNGDV